MAKRLISALLLLAGMAQAETNYIFEAEPPYTNDISSYITTNTPPPVSVTGRIILSVTRAQYEAGFAKLPAATIIQALTAARAYEADYRNWEDRRLKAAVAILLEEINSLRARAGLPQRTATDVSEALGAELAR